MIPVAPRFNLLVLGLTLASAPVVAQEEDIRSVITAQIEAFQLDDFAAAFDFAAPQIKEYFKTPEKFGTMVRNGYPMVHRPQSYRFETLQGAGSTRTQFLEIKALDGESYIAQYDMILTSDGWRIAGVQIFRSTAIEV